MRFKNKTVFITGAAGGIGRQTGISFAKEGARVALSDLDLDMFFLKYPRLRWS